MVPQWFVSEPADCGADRDDLVAESTGGEHRCGPEASCEQIWNRRFTNAQEASIGLHWFDPGRVLPHVLFSACKLLHCGKHGSVQFAFNC